MLKKLGLLLVGLVLVLAACGDDGAAGGLSAEEQAFADEMVGQLTADTSPDNVMASEADATCAAEGVVAAFGLERSEALFGEAADINDLAAIGAEMTAEEQDTFAGIVVGCVDLAEVMSAGLAEGSAGAIDEEAANCVAGQITPDAQKQMLIAQLSGEDVDPTAILAAVNSCVDMQAVMEQTLLDMEMPQEAVDCIMDGLSEDFFTNMVGGLVAGEDASFADPQFMSLLMTCTAG